jgi:hypothetical protein
MLVEQACRKSRAGTSCLRRHCTHPRIMLLGTVVIMLCSGKVQSESLVPNRFLPAPFQCGLPLPTFTDGVQALVRGMSLALDAGEAWHVANGAVRAWNTALPVLRQQRHCELLPLLEAVAEVCACFKTTSLTDCGSW